MQELTAAITACEILEPDQDSQNSSMDEGAHGVPPRTEELLAARECWRGKACCLQGMPPKAKNATVDAPHP